MLSYKSARKIVNCKVEFEKYHIYYDEELCS